MKQPQDCLNIQEIRAAIYSLDRDIINKLGQRFEYVKPAAKFSNNTEEDIKTVVRFNSMLQQRRVWAEENNLHPDVVEKLYRDLVNYLINEELRHWEVSKDKL